MKFARVDLPKVFTALERRLESCLERVKPLGLAQSTNVQEGHQCRGNCQHRYWGERVSP
jgi:hypothetical protein